MAAQAPDTRYLSLSVLDFDLDNPRFADASYAVGADDESVVRFYLEEVDLRELLDSITTSGYISFDPMLVIPNGKRFTVLEGNRRLAALKVLTNKMLAKSLRIEIEAMTASLKKTLESIAVRVMTSRADGRAYIGFKHINGPHKWDAMAKAKYAAEWLDDGGNIEVITKTLGDRNDFVRRLIFGHKVLKQAEANGFPRTRAKTKRFAFSHLYTALTRPGFRSYLGLVDDPRVIPRGKTPIPRSHVPELVDVMGWLYGDAELDLQPVIRSQNPDLNRLNEILQRPKAKRDFLARRNLDLAAEEIVPRSSRFTEALLSALSSTEHALALIADYDQSRDLLEQAETLAVSATFLLNAMKAPRRAKTVR